MSVLHNRFLFFPYLIVHQVFHSLRRKRFKKAGDESKKEDPSRINLIGLISPLAESAPFSNSATTSSFQIEKNSGYTSLYSFV